MVFSAKHPNISLRVHLKSCILLHNIQTYPKGTHLKSSKFSYRIAAMPAAYDCTCLTVQHQRIKDGVVFQIDTHVVRYTFGTLSPSLQRIDKTIQCEQPYHGRHHGNHDQRSQPGERFRPALAHREQRDEESRRQQPRHDDERLRRQQIYMLGPINEWRIDLLQ